MGDAFAKAGWAAGPVSGILGDEINKFLEGPKIPEPPKPEAPVEKGEEGVRRGSMQRQARHRALGQIYLTRGQQRGTGVTLGGQGATLG